MKKLIVFISILVLSLCFFTTGCRQQVESSKSQEMTRPGSQQAAQSQESKSVSNSLSVSEKTKDWLAHLKPISLSTSESQVVRIETAKIGYLEFKPFLTAMGKVLAPYTRTSLISYAFPARIYQIRVNVGDWVKASSPLVTLQSQEVGQARADFFKAQADFELAKTNYERQRRLYEHGAGAQKDFLTAEAEIKIARAELEAMEKRLHLLGFTEEDVTQIANTHQINPTITLYSPIAGKVIDIKVIPGEMIDQSKEIMTILDPGILWADAEIFEKDIPKVKPGQQVEIAVEALPDRVFHGKISYIGDVLKDETRTITVRTEVINEGLLLKPGMFASIKIYLNDGEKTLAAPEEAVCDYLGQKFVFIAQQGKFEPRPISLGVRLNGHYQVLKGLSEGEQVVTTGSFELKSKLFEEELKKSIHD
jgi:cobalt-zinc-cadmium efflux system membrane fusion protein